MAERRIFVNIASYRDSECQWTVRDLFEKAAHPDRIFVGVCWQFVPGDDDDCFKIETRPEQVRTLEFHAKESRGVGWARHHSQSLWRDEEFTLQIDSHMRFVANWDEVLLGMYDSCPSERAVLTTYPIPYTPPNDLAPDAIVTIEPKFFDTNGILMFKSRASPPASAPDIPAASSFCAAGLLFAPSAIITDVPYDPSIYFQGEEITLAVRLWTHDWDIFTPNKLIAYHDYSDRPDRIRHWKDEVNWAVLNKTSMARVRHLLHMEKSSDPTVLSELNQYSLGTARSLAAYEQFSGINFARRSIDGKVSIGSPKLENPKPSPDRQRTFTSIWNNNGWGSDETRSGQGSSLLQTSAIRKRLPELFSKYQIGTLADVCCGDFNWMPDVADKLDIYLGFDIVAPLISKLTEKHEARKNCFFRHFDAVVDQIPKCDAVLVRDGFTHFTAADARSAIRNLCNSKTEYLIATSHPSGQFAEISTGGWYPMDLTATPFSFPPPLAAVSEDLAGSKKNLSLWRLADLTDYL